MSREILFRGKRVDNGEWVHSTFIMQDKKMELLTHEVELFDGKRWVAIIPETVGQYIGLCDKNGNKIFEGDILVFVDAETPETERAIVVYDDGGYKLKYLNYDYMDNLDSAMAELQVIIGNIHDNPELLEVEK